MKTLYKADTSLDRQLQLLPKISVLKSSLCTQQALKQHQRPGGGGGGDYHIKSDWDCRLPTGDQSEPLLRLYLTTKGDYTITKYDGICLLEYGYFSTLSDTLVAKILAFLPEHSKLLSPSEMTSTPVILLWKYPGHQDLALKIIYSLTKHLFKLNCLVTACNNDNQWQDKMEKCHILEDFF